MRRAYYHCRRCRHGHFPLDGRIGLEHGLSPGVQPLVALAGVLGSFADAAEDLLRRFCGLTVCPSTVQRLTESAGGRAQQQQRAGRPIAAAVEQPAWKLEVPEREATAAYLGLDAFSVPMQGPDGGAADHRMLYVGLLYTPDKRHTCYLVDFDLKKLTAQLRLYAVAFGLGRADDLLAVTDGGNGLEEALRGAFWDGLQFILDWYHAMEHVHAFGQVLHARDPDRAREWARAAETILWQRGGEALAAYLDGLPIPDEDEGREGLRKLRGYVAGNAHRMDYPEYRRRGWDVGSGPTEAGCKVLGARLKGSGMRWGEAGAEQVAVLRALYQSREGLWDGFWSQPRQPAA